MNTEHQRPVDGKWHSGPSDYSGQAEREVPERIDQIPYHAELQCYVSFLQYDFATQTGVVFMAEDSCTDMSGCTDLFQRIDPEIQVIRTFAGAAEDTAYLRVNGNWIAHFAAPQEQ
ncbi:hypothetical protein D3C80_368790 [compost metagenome]